MYNDKFTNRYKNIPIAKFSHVLSNITSQSTFTFPQLHKEFEIILIKEGTAHITIDKKQIIAKSNDLVFINPYALHSLEIPPQDKFDYICFCFDLSMIAGAKLGSDLLSDTLCVKEHITLDSSYCRELVRLLCETEYAMDEDSPYREVKVMGNINLLFSVLLKNGLITATTFPPRDRDFCIKVFHFIETHFSENVTSETVSLELGFNQSYFCRLFKKNFGMRFSDFLTDYRLDRAKKLLADSSESITVISQKTGFCDTSYFSKVFKSRTGITPKDYRKSVL